MKEILAVITVPFTPAMLESVSTQLKMGFRSANVWAQTLALKEVADSKLNPVVLKVVRAWKDGNPIVEFHLAWAKARPSEDLIETCRQLVLATIASLQA